MFTYILLCMISWFTWGGVAILLLSFFFSFSFLFSFLFFYLFMTKLVIIWWWPHQTQIIASSQWRSRSDVNGNTQRNFGQSEREIGFATDHWHNEHSNGNGLFERSQPCPITRRGASTRWDWKNWLTNVHTQWQTSEADMQTGSQADKLKHRQTDRHTVRRNDHQTIRRDK